MAGNIILVAPGSEDLLILHAGTAMVSTWELTPEELAEIQRTGRLHLVVYGAGHPPVMLTPYEEHVLPIVMPAQGVTN